MKITVFGAGYVGLVTATCFAHMGNQVTCVDINVDKIKRLQQGQSPIYEKDLEPMIQANLQANRLHFTTQAKESVKEAEVIFVAVGTPPKTTGEANLQYVMQVSETIAEHINGYKIIVNKSTVPVGTADKMTQMIQASLEKQNKKFEFAVVSNPEFLKEGTAVSDCLRGDRIIVGSSSSKAIELMKQLYAPVNRNRDKLMVMDVRSAEMTKYAANAMLATKISFMNEMSQIAEKVGADIEAIRHGMGADQRIGYHFIYPGCGYGGSCFPKDVSALAHIALADNYQPQLLQAVEAVNAAQKQWLFGKINQYFKEDLAGKTIAIWGLAFKPNTDDIREAPARVLIEQLWKQGAKVRCFDPQAMDCFKHEYGARDDYTLCDSAEETLEHADALAILTEWMCFRAPDFKLIKEKLTTPVIFDGRNLYNPKILAQHGLAYYAVGRRMNN